MGHNMEAKRGANVRLTQNKELGLYRVEKKIYSDLDDFTWEIMFETSDCSSAEEYYRYLTRVLLKDSGWVIVNEVGN